jgi:serine protease AprX
MRAAIGGERLRGAGATAVAAQPTRTIATVLLLVALVLPGLARPQTAFPGWKLDPGLVTTLERAPGRLVDVIVHETRAASHAAEDAVRAVGGLVIRQLPIVQSFAARLEASALPSLARSASIANVWGDGTIHMRSASTAMYDTWGANTEWRRSIRLPGISDDYTGAGVTVALLDTGVARNPDIKDAMIARVDFTPELDGKDRYGHGTHMAGIIGGDGSASEGRWRGVAPGVKLVSVKVAGADGSTDVSIVIAALQWIMANRAAYGIRILNLSFGTDSRQSYSIDPLNYAIEQLWLRGVLVVVAAGNRGGVVDGINKPGDDPYVVTVGAADLKGTLEREDDVVAPFSSWGTTPDGYLKPDLLAPGITIVATRAAGSTVEAQHADALVGDSYMKGTGTSQATAVVTGVAALIYQANPLLSPDMAKKILMRTAYKNPSFRSGGGAGLVDAAGAVQSARNGSIETPANIGLVPSTGLGSLEASRGSFHVYADPDGDGVPQLITGEIDALGQPWTATSWAATSWGATSWAATSWASLVVVNPGWTATSWAATSWSGTSWSATSWGATSWGATSWAATSWSADGWS